MDKRQSVCELLADRGHEVNYPIVPHRPRSDRRIEILPVEREHELDIERRLGIRQQPDDARMRVSQLFQDREFNASKGLRVLYLTKIDHKARAYRDDTFSCKRRGSVTLTSDKNDICDQRSNWATAHCGTRSCDDIYSSSDRAKV